MASELKIRWDGDVPGVAEHRLSLAAFGEPLTQLLAALRRIATQMVGTAVEREHPKIGRFANLARQLDIEITSIEGDSTGFNGLVSFYQPPDELPLFADLPERAVTELLDSIERESKGQAANWAVRKYLSALPPTIHRQTYELHENGTSKKRVEIGDVTLMEVPEEFPSLREVDGTVIGVGFEPGRSEVRVKGASTTANFDASDEQVEMALTIRKENVRSLGVYDGKRARLLLIAKASAPRFKVTDEAIEEYIFKRWGGVFARLAK
jgi:hypothetical protein